MRRIGLIIVFCIVTLGIVAQVQVKLYPQMATSAIYISPINWERYQLLPTSNGYWEGTLDIGKYKVKACASDCDERITIIDVTNEGNIFSIQAPVRQTGTLRVKVHPRDAHVKVDGKEELAREIVLPTGSHNVSVSKYGYTSDGDQLVYIFNGQTTDVELDMSSDWIHADDDHPNHFLEFMYGCGIQNDYKHYLGFTYGYLPKRFGFNLSGMAGLNTNEYIMTIGPSMRLTKFDSSLNLQLSVGAGAVYNPQILYDNKFTWAMDAGLRFGFRPENEFAWYSFNLGFKYFNDQVVPTASLSLMPIRWLCLAGEADSDLSAHRVETVAGYSFKSKNWRVGINYSWNQTALGIYTQALIGWNNNYSVTAGPTIRLNPNANAFDLQLYQGIGWFRDYGDFLGGETGIRMGFGEDNGSNFGWWSINAAFEYAQKKYYGINFGISLMPAKISALLADCYSDMSAHRVETVAGYSFKSNDWRVGINYSWNQTALGVYTQMLFGWKNNYSVTLGPTIRLNPNAYAFDLQLYQGIGWYRDGRDMIGGETGIRMGFGEDNGSNFGWWSINAAFEYAQKKYYGINFGISLMPVRILTLLGNTYSSLPAHRVETMVGFGLQSGSVKMGANYTWNQAVWGVYTQLLVGIDENASWTVGPSIRLTPNASVFDLQVYQGIGWFLDGKNMIGGETGIRFGFSNPNGGNFGWWSFNVGFEYAQDGYYGINCGLSLSLLGTAGLAAGAIAGAVIYYAY